MTVRVAGCSLLNLYIYTHSCPHKSQETPDVLQSSHWKPKNVIQEVSYDPFLFSFSSSSFFNKTNGGEGEKKQPKTFGHLPLK